MTVHAPIKVSKYTQNKGRLSPWCKPVDVLVDCLEVLTPPSRISVVDCAIQSRKMQEDTGHGDWDPDKVPYMVEPMNMMASRLYTGLVFIGPARAGKSDSLILNGILYLMTSASCKAMLVGMDQQSMSDYSTAEIDRMIRNCEDLRNKQETGRGAQTLYRKLFRGGGRLTLQWPTPAAFAQKTLRYVFLTERDRMPENIGGDGDPFSLARRRVQIAGSNGMVVEETSPSKPIKDPNWAPKTIHEAPPCDGGLNDYNLGTRARYYWTCPHCDDEFQADFSKMKCEDGDNIQERAQNAHMTCSNGCVIDQTEKREMNKNGRWLHESECGQRAVPLGDPDIRKTNIVSYWLKGVAAAFQSWPKLTFDTLQAEETFKNTGSEQALQTVYNTGHGEPFLSRVMTTQEELNADKLKERAEFRQMGIVPKGVCFLTAQVDVQGSSFEVQIDGWGSGLERWLIDRYSITAPPDSAPAALDADGKTRRAILPPQYSEDWKALDSLEDKIYPVADENYGLKIRAITIDRNGKSGTTEKAYAFWRAKKKAGLSHRWFLNTGVSNKQAERMIFAPPQRSSDKYRQTARDVPIIKLHSTLMKDETFASLTREDIGPGYYHLPATMEARFFEEFCAEVRTESKWVPKKSGLRNECFDLAYYGKGLVLQLGGETIDWSSPPAWAREGKSNTFAVEFEAPVTDATDAIEIKETVAPQNPVQERAKRFAEIARRRLKKA